MRLASAAKLRRSRLKLESLEGREVPASVVTVTNTGGLLSLVGNDENSGLTLKVEAAQVTVTPNATTDVGGGNGVAQVFAGTATSLLADMKGGDDSIDIDGASALTLTGAATFKMGDGDNNIDLTTAAKIELGSLSVSTGDGFDVFTMAGGAALGSKVTGNTSFDFKVGIGTIDLTETEFQGSAGVKVKVAPKGSASAVTLTNVKIAKTLDVNNGTALFGGNNITGSTLGGIKVKGFIATVGLDTSTVNGNVSVSSGSYQGAVFLANSKITGDTKINGGFAGVMYTDGASEAGNVSITGGLISRFDANGFGAVSMKVNGNLSVSGKDAATIDFNTSALSEVTGDVSLKSGGLYGQLTSNQFVKFSGNVNVNLGDGQGGVGLGDGTLPVAILGNLTIKGGSGDSFITLNSVTVAQKTSIKLGAGTDFVSINDESVFTGTFDADLGKGDDVFSVGQNLGATAPVTFTGKATIKTGDGNDLLELGVGIGGDLNSKAVFSGAGSKIDGGKGFNTFDDGPSSNYSGLVFGTSIVNFTDPAP